MTFFLFQRLFRIIFLAFYFCVGLLFHRCAAVFQQWIQLFRVCNQAALASCFPAHHTNNVHPSLFISSPISHLINHFIPADPTFFSENLLWHDWILYIASWKMHHWCSDSYCCSLGHIVFPPCVIFLTSEQGGIAARKCSLSILPVKQVGDLVLLANRRTTEPIVCQKSQRNNT